MLFAGAAEEEAAWEGGTPPGTPCSLGVLAAAGPCVAELSPTAAAATGAGGAEPGQLHEEVRIGGRGALSFRGAPGDTSQGDMRDFTSSLSWEAKHPSLVGGCVSPLSSLPWGVRVGGP